jgi:hypothetical protein
MSPYKYVNVDFSFQIHSQKRRQPVGDNLRFDNRCALAIIGEITVRPHTRYPEYCLLSEEQNLCRKKNTTWEPS